MTDYPQEVYHAAANGHGRHPPPWHLPSVNLSHDDDAIVVGGNGNGGPDYLLPQRPYTVVASVPGLRGRDGHGDGFTTHNQGAYANPGKAAIAHAFKPKEHVRGRGEWRIPHDDGTFKLDPARFASPAETTSGRFQKTTAAMAAADRAANGPRDMPRRHMWNRTATTVSTKGGDGADVEVVPHYRAVHSGARPEERRTLGRDPVVDCYGSSIVMKSPAAGTKDAMGTTKYGDDFNADGYAVSARPAPPVRNTSTVPIKQTDGTVFHNGVSDYHGSFGKPQRKDYHRRLDTVGLGTKSKVPLVHDAKTVW